MLIQHITRIGGDEFDCIIYYLNEGDFLKKKMELTGRLEELSKNLKYDLNIAVGSAMYSKKSFQDKFLINRICFII